MARDRDHLAESFETENSGGWLTGFLAEEDRFDRRSLWRLGSWGVGAVGAVIVAMLANQSSIKSHLDQVASADLARQSQQIQRVAKESQSEARRLASAIDTLNGDRDRLYSRVTVLEQGLDTATGSIHRQNSATGSPQAVLKPVNPDGAPQTATQNPALPPVIASPAVTADTTEKDLDAAVPPEPLLPAPVASSRAAVTPATPLMATKSMLAPPDLAASKLSEPTAAVAESSDATASISAAPRPDSAAARVSLDITVQRTEFGVDLGGANSIDGLRALWLGLLKSNNSLAALRPIIVVKERSNRAGLQLRLVAGPLGDATAAAKICAGLGDLSCETSVFDGQRLAIKGDDSPAPVSVRFPRKRSSAKRVKPAESVPKPKTSALSSFLGTR